MEESGEKHQKILKLEEQLNEAEAVLRELIKAGSIPTPADYSEVDRIKKALKTARRVNTIQAGRTEPIKEVGIGLCLDREEHQRLSDKAAAAALTLPNYIRRVLKDCG